MQEKEPGGQWSPSPTEKSGLALRRNSGMQMRYRGNVSDSQWTLRGQLFHAEIFSRLMALAN